MNTPSAMKRAQGSSDAAGEEHLDEHQEFTNEPEAGSLVDLPQRASAMTPLMSDILAHVEGIQRWGLNE